MKRGEEERKGLPGIYKNSGYKNSGYKNLYKISSGGLGISGMLMGFVGALGNFGSLQGLSRALGILEVR